MVEFISQNIVGLMAALFAMTTMIFAIMTFFSRGKRPSRLFFQPMEPLNIYKSFYAGFKGFDIKYKDNPISDNVLFISGEMTCKGKDIDSTGNEIQVKAPEGCSWIDIIALNQPNNNNASVTISQTNSQHAFLSFDKLRKDKSFTINAILKDSAGHFQNTKEYIKNNLEFEHTIKDVDDVKITTDNTYNILNRIHRILGFIAILSGSLYCCSVTGYSLKVVFVTSMMVIVGAIMSFFKPTNIK